MRIVGRLATLAIAAIMIGAVFPGGTAVGATTFKVTRFTDPAPGACLPGDCSLREAVVAANGTPGPDIIKVPGGTYTLNRVGPGGASEGDLDITDDVTITKTGSGGIAMVDGSGPLTQDRIFEITGADAILRNIGARNGVAAQEGATTDPRHGGGVRVDPGASLQMIGGAVISNLAPNTASLGGGVYNAGQLSLKRVVVENNQVEFGFGGGIDTDTGATTSVDKSVVRDNTTAFGGGFSGPGQTTVTQSLIRGNDAGLGGAFYLGGAGLYTVAASTVSDNVASDRGGAVRTRNGSITFSNSTISENVAGTDGGGIAAQDDAGAPPTNVTLKHTILAGNVDQDTAGGNKPDCYDQTGGLFVSNGNNIVGNADGCTIVPTTGDQIGSGAAPVDPGLGSLQFNGGPLVGSLTYALMPTSPALDKGGTCEPSDQRGVPSSPGPCDSGSYQRVLCRNVLVNRVGTPGNDSSQKQQLRSTRGADGYLGFEGKDRFSSGRGNDGLCGGPGNDNLLGGRGGDKEAGGQGNDHLFGDAGNDAMNGGAGKDTCSGGPGHDRASHCEKRLGIP